LLNDDISEAEQIRAKHQATLEKNRDLISLLKEQLKKSVDKQKEVSKDTKLDIKQQKIELLQSENQKTKKESEKLNTQNELLKEQVTQLKL